MISRCCNSMRMKNKCVLTALIFVALSCTQKQEQDVDGRNFTCVFLPVDAYRTTLDSNYWYDYNGEVLLTLNSSVLDPASVLDPTRIFNKRDDDLQQKQAQLTEAMKAAIYHYDYGPDKAYIMSGGGSGEAVIYSDKRVLGKEPGENLAEFFTVSTRGRVHYPEMSLLADGARSSMEPVYVDLPFTEYFAEGMVPWALESGFIFIALKNPGFGPEEDVTFFVKIPVSGINRNGEETTVEFTAECRRKS